MRPCSGREQRGGGGARDGGRGRGEGEPEPETEVNIKVHSLKPLVTPLILDLRTARAIDTRVRARACMRVSVFGIVGLQH